jgi:hypothetical protein
MLTVSEDGKSEAYFETLKNGKILIVTFRTKSSGQEFKVVYRKVD